MSNDALMAVSPIDGRYYSKTKELREYFSEYALIRYRVRIEIEYFIELTKNDIPQLKGFDKNQFNKHFNRFLNTPDAVLVRKSPKHR